MDETTLLPESLYRSAIHPGRLLCKPSAQNYMSSESSNFSRGLSNKLQNMDPPFGASAPSTLIKGIVFILQRVHALWGYQTKILTQLVIGCSLTYVTVFALDIYCLWKVLTTIAAKLSYSSVTNACVLSERPTITVYPLAIPILYDIYLFGFMVRNALQRPLHLRTTLVKQLHIDGGFYFFITIALRLMNILVISVANIAYANAALYFFWAVINTALNRMLISFNVIAAHNSKSQIQTWQFSQNEAHIELNNMPSQPEDTETSSRCLDIQAIGGDNYNFKLDLSNPRPDGSSITERDEEIAPSAPYKKNKDNSFEYDSDINGIINRF
ncbi:hypothetical protein M422DRAFT_45206 [Sphaerobolus stellatus SS14]|nr:hypothetical protein M422DRAFT_45206 [Sphaerobolus stellatus SS14]